MVPANIKSYLDERGVSYQTASHAPSATAQDTAASAHISGKRFGKTVVLKRGDQFMMALLPANETVDFEALRQSLGTPVELAAEEELGQLFPDCEVGAMPPLGGLYGLPVVADECLAHQGMVAINGGTHTDVIELRWDDYVACEHPQIIPH